MSDLQVEFLQRLIKINSWSLQRRQEEEKLLRLQRELRSRVRYLMCTLFRNFLDCFNTLLQMATPDLLRRPCSRHYLNDFLKGSSTFMADFPPSSSNIKNEMIRNNPKIITKKM
jgi:hypothetical protein